MVRNFCVMYVMRVDCRDLLLRSIASVLSWPDGGTRLVHSLQLKRFEISTHSECRRAAKALSQTLASAERVASERAQMTQHESPRVPREAKRGAVLDPEPDIDVNQAEQRQCETLDLPERSFRFRQRFAP